MNSFRIVPTYSVGQSMDLYNQHAVHMWNCCILVALSSKHDSISRLNWNSGYFIYATSYALPNDPTVSGFVPCRKLFPRPYYGDCFYVRQALNVDWSKRSGPGTDRVGGAVTKILLHLLRSLWKPQGNECGWACVPFVDMALRGLKGVTLLHVSFHPV